MDAQLEQILDEIATDNQVASDLVHSASADSVAQRGVEATFREHLCLAMALMRSTGDNYRRVDLSIGGRITLKDGK